MAILFCSITMSQYTHFNLNPITQLTMQMTFRTLSFVAETCTFRISWTCSLHHQTRLSASISVLEYHIDICQSGSEHLSSFVSRQQVHPEQDFNEESAYNVVFGNAGRCRLCFGITYERPKHRKQTNVADINSVCCSIFDCIYGKYCTAVD